MIDERLDEQLKRLSRAIAAASPDPPALADESTRRIGFRPIRAMASGFTIALLFGLATALVIAQRAPERDEATGPAELGDQTRWEWIVDNSAPAANDALRAADPAATPLPTFDYEDLGVEQRLDPSDPEPLAFNPLGGDDTPSTPLVYVGRVLGTEVSAYLFEADVDQISITRSLLCFAVVVPNGGSSACEHDSLAESTDPDHIIGGTSVAPDELPPGVSLPELIVDFGRLPLDTALVVLRLDDGRVFVQRPVIGVAVIVIDRLDGAGIDSAEALDMTGRVIIHEDFGAAWEQLEQHS